MRIRIRLADSFVRWTRQSATLRIAEGRRVERNRPLCNAVGPKIAVVTHVAHSFGNTDPELSRCLLCEGPKDDFARGRESLQDDVGCSRDERCGFPRARTGDDQERPFQKVNRFQLGLVESRESLSLQSK